MTGRDDRPVRPLRACISATLRRSIAVLRQRLALIVEHPCASVESLLEALLDNRGWFFQAASEARARCGGLRPMEGNRGLPHTLSPQALAEPAERCGQGAVETDCLNKDWGLSHGPPAARGVALRGSAERHQVRPQGPGSR